jgi:hypothetical protein
MADHAHHVTTAVDFAADPHIRLDPVATVLAALLVWTLLGLWLWMDYSDDIKREKRFLTFLFAVVSGPAAWIICIWALSHPRRAVLPRKTLHRQAWEAPSEYWRN